MTINIKSFLNCFKASKTKTVIYDKEKTILRLQAFKLSLQAERTKGRNKRDSFFKASLKWNYNPFITIII